MSARKCNARSKRTGQPCGANAMDGKEKCYHHGGASTGAPIKTGRYSKFLPTQLAGHYEDAINDADLISLRGEAELVQTLIFDAVQALDFNQCQAAWDSLEALAKGFFSADAAEKAEIGREMCNVVNDGVEAWRQVRNVLGYVESKRKLAETESKRIKETAETMNAKQAMALVAVLAAAVREEFHDQPDRVARVSAKLAVVIGGGAVAASA